MLEQLKEEVLKANKLLSSEHLAILTWGNVSGFDPEKGLVVIKGSGVEYNIMESQHLTVLDLGGNVVEGECNPSTDLDTHLEIYRNFKNVRGIVHTHSTYATVWAQKGRAIPCYGTTHADYFKGDIPCTRKITKEEIGRDYEKNTGKVIVETFCGLDPDVMRAVLVRCHGPFVWGNSALDALHNAVVLENVAKMAFLTDGRVPGQEPLVDDELLKKHYNRKFGADAYYGQSGETK